MKKIRCLTFLYIRKSTILVISSSLGETNCSGCCIFKKGRILYAKRVEQPRFVSLPIKIAEMRNVADTDEALRRIQYAIKAGHLYVNLTDLESNTVSCAD